MSILKEGKPVGLACDHAGYEMKQIVMQELDVRGIAYKDFGTYSNRQVGDYPDFGTSLWLWLWKRVNVIRVSLFAVVGMV